MRLARTLAGVALTTVVLAAGCQTRTEVADERRSTPDARLLTHDVEASTPTPERIDYVEAVAEAHRLADAAGDAQARRAELHKAMDLAVPEGLGEAEILRLSLAARLGRSYLDEGSHRRAIEVVSPLVELDRSLPIDVAAADALVVLGDAAAEDGDDALAVGSYARAVRMMSLLRDEVMP